MKKVKSATINQKDQEILDFIASLGQASTKDILKFLEDKSQSTSRFTVIRMMTDFISAGYVKKVGKGRSVAYTLSPEHRKLQTYFTSPAIKRELVSDRYDARVFDTLVHVFTHDELKEIEDQTKKYRMTRDSLPQIIFKKELERLTIELAWKSSEIEGNTYSLLETEVLLSEKIQAEHHSKDEAIMLLNHKKTLNYIYENREQYKTITVGSIQDIHNRLTADLGISYGIRRNSVGITGTQYRPLDVPERIHQALDDLVNLINKTKHPLEKALIALLLVAYIQPFEDGNKRTSRLLSDAILFAYDYCPISYRSMDALTYKKAMILFYEQHDIFQMKKLFIEQYLYAVKTYFR